VTTLNTFQGTSILRASRGLLCDSSAVLFSYRIYMIVIYALERMQMISPLTVIAESLLSGITLLYAGEMSSIQLMLWSIDATADGGGDVAAALDAMKQRRSTTSQRNRAMLHKVRNTTHSHYINVLSVHSASIASY